MTVTTDVSSSVVPLNKLVYLFYTAGFLFVGGGFVLLTSGADLRFAPEPGAGSALSQTILAFFYCTGGLLLLTNRNVARVLQRAWPILLLPLLAVVSASWSPEPLLSLRRALAFAGTTLFGLSLGAAYSARDLICLIARSLTLACLFSCAIVFVNPLYGLHQPSDAIQAVHAGFWRGIFGHRNPLGLWAGVSVAVILIFGRYSFEKVIMRAAALLLALACLIGARSGTGFVISVVMIVISLALLTFSRQPPSRRGLVLILIVLGTVAALLLRKEITSWSLYLLGKDSDLTGRTLLWYYILQITEKTSSVFGGGYFVGFFSLNTEISSITRTNFGSAHNGYLETFVYLGYAGLAVCIAALLWLLYCAARQMLDCPPHEAHLRIFPVSVLLVVAFHNFVESTIVLPNNLNVLLASVVAGMLAMPKNLHHGTIGRRN